MWTASAAKICGVELQHLRGLHQQGVHCAFQRNGYATRGTLLLSSHHVREGACAGECCGSFCRCRCFVYVCKGIPRGLGDDREGTVRDGNNAWEMVGTSRCSYIVLHSICVPLQCCFVTCRSLQEASQSQFLHVFASVMRRMPYLHSQHSYPII
jgi:hypothetical protein